MSANAITSQYPPCVFFTRNEGWDIQQYCQYLLVVERYLVVQGHQTFVGVQLICSLHIVDICLCVEVAVQAHINSGFKWPYGTIVTNYIIMKYGIVLLKQSLKFGPSVGRQYVVWINLYSVGRQYAVFKDLLASSFIIQFSKVETL